MSLRIHLSSTQFEKTSIKKILNNFSSTCFFSVCISIVNILEFSSVLGKVSRIILVHTQVISVFDFSWSYISITTSDGFVIQSMYNLVGKNNSSLLSKILRNWVSNSKLIFTLQNKVIWIKRTHLSPNCQCFTLILLILGLVLVPKICVLQWNNKKKTGTRA